MRKTTKWAALAACLWAGSMQLQAQQVKGDFDVQTPWEGNMAGAGYPQFGTVADGWSSSNVVQDMGFMKLMFPLVYEDANRTETQGKSLRLENLFVGMGAPLGSNAPGYITLGETWVYADVQGLMDVVMGVEGAKDYSDGGSKGGVSFSFRPDSLVGYYKRKFGTEAESMGGPVKQEEARIIVYMWKGTAYSQSPVHPGTADKSQLLVDRDLDILGMNTPDSSSVVLVGKGEYTISGELNEWTRIAIPIEYTDTVTDAPEKMNIIISSANYYSRADIGDRNKLWADDVAFVYNAKLKNLTIGGNTVGGFDEDVFSYTLPEEMSGDVITAEAYGAGATIRIGDLAEGKRVITVTDPTAAGEKTYTYTLIFKGSKSEITVPQLADSYIYGDSIDFVPVSTNTDTPILYTFSEPSFAKVENNKLFFTGAGETMLTISQEGSDNYAPVILDPVKITVTQADLTIGLKDLTRQRGKSNPAPEFTYSGFKNNDDETKLDEIFTVKPDALIDAKTGSDIGSYPITFKKVAVAPNYNILYDESTPHFLHVTKADLTVSVQTERPFGEQNPETWTLQYTGLYFADEAAEVINGLNDLVITCDATPESPVGVYPVRLSGDLTSDLYNITLAEGSLTVKYKTTVTVTFPEGLKYGDGEFTFEVSSNNTDGPVFYYYTRTSELFSVPSYKVAKGVVNGAGEAKLLVKTTATDNFLAYSDTIRFNIAKAPLTVTAVDTARMAGEVNPLFKLMYEGFVNGDDETKAGVFTTFPAASCEAGTESPAGEYPIVPVGGEAPNYELSYVNGTLTVRPVSAIAGQGAAGIKVYFAGNALQVRGNVAADPIFVYDMQGVLLGEWDGSETTIRASFLKDHVYMVRIGNRTDRVLFR